MWKSIAIAVCGLGACAPVAGAHDKNGSGGAAAPEAPAIESVSCADEAAWRCEPGAAVTVQGEGLHATRKVTFLGRRGARDNRKARPSAADVHSVSVVVPADAASGRVRVTGRRSFKSDSRRKLRIAAPSAAQRAASPEVFPVRGQWSFGTSYANQFGGGRGHQGFDVFAACGTPLVAAADATVKAVQYHSAAGYYVVMERPGGEAFAYMHLQRPATVRVGDSVKAGQPVGAVGDTGRATGCHLHFELWTAPGWYEGGRAIDPLPQLKEWAR